MPLILGTNSIKDTSYNVANSLRFNDDSSDFLNRTPSSAGNRRTFTISAWVKRGQVTTSSFLFGAWTADNDAGHFAFGFESAERLTVDTYSTNLLTTTRVFRDPGAWMHVVCAVDTTSGTADQRVRLYVNGTEETVFSTRNNPSQNADLQANNSVIQVVGANYYNSQANVTHDGYMAEFCMIDGQQLTPTSFGEFDSDSPNIWKPKDVSGLTFGTNGFYQEYKQSGTSQNSSGLGADTSGQDNHFAVNNLTAIDQSTDTCTNNFATLNPLYTNDGAITYSEGNLKAAAGSGSASWTTRYAFSSIGVSAGRWYVEAKCVDSGVGPEQFYFGVGKDINTWSFNSSLGYEDTGQGWGYYANNGNIVNNGNDLYTSGNSYTDGDIISMELDLEDMTLDFYKNGVKEGYQVTSLPAGTYHFAINGYQTIDGEFNFGSPPYSISSGNTDGNGYGNFEYSVPSGHYALNTKNLAEFG